MGKGIVTLAAGGGTLPNATVGELGDFAPGNWLHISSTAGKVTGVATLEAHVAKHTTSAVQMIGQVLATGSRQNRGVASDQFAGPSIGTGDANASGHYIVARIDCGSR